MSEEAKEQPLDPAVEKPKSSWFWIKDSSGYPSVSITMLAISFWVTTVVYILSIVHKIGPVEMRDFNVGASGAYFGLILTTYVARRFTDAKYGNPYVPNVNTYQYSQPPVSPNPLSPLPSLGPRV